MNTGKLFIASTFCAVLLSLLPTVVFAQNVLITPSTIESSGSVEKALQQNKGAATTKLEGQGGILRITYEASEAITIFMVPLSDAKSYVLTDFITLSLPAVTKETVDIDLTRSPGWSPSPTMWILRVLTKDEHAVAGFHSVEFIPVTFVKTVSTVLRHALTKESYAPSTYHGLHGYRITSIELTIILGVLLLAICTAGFVATRKRRLSTVIMIIVTMHLLYGLRFSLDLLRFSRDHLTGYASGAYDEAGSIYRVAATLVEMTPDNRKDMSVFVCRSGNDYTEKILRYVTYPMTVTSDFASLKKADFALAMDTDNWTYETVNDAKGIRELLHCGTRTLSVHTIAQYPDGSILFTILP
ncbi:MAG: hypothetical protein ABL879_19060 [Devosia sp.]